jgi:hypothetical protein
MFDIYKNVRLYFSTFSSFTVNASTFVAFIIRRLVTKDYVNINGSADSDSNNFKTLSDSLFKISIPFFVNNGSLLL